MELSQLHFHSIGQVSANKSMGSDEIKVIPIEYRFNSEEGVVNKINPEDINIRTNKGDDVVSINHTNSLSAKWLKLNSNRITAPDVRRNDKVIILRLGTSEVYFWMDFNDRNVKRLETIVYAWSADPDKPIADDLSNAYYLEISTHAKTITLVTSQANEEPYGYTLQLNTGEGHFVLQDTEGNEILLDTAETLIRLLNASKTKFELNKRDINGFAPDNISFKAGKTFSIECTDYKLNASNSIATSTKTHSSSASSGYSMNTPAAAFSTDVTVGNNLSVSNALDAKSGAIKSISGDSANIKTASFPNGHGPH